MRALALCLATTLTACGDAPRPQSQEAAAPTRPGAPIAALVGDGCGRLHDERVFCFDKRGFVDAYAGARTLAASGTGFMSGEEQIAHCFARADGVLRCSGSNELGGLGVADAPDTCHTKGWFDADIAYECAKEPTVVPASPPTIQLSESCALSSDGVVWCWGKNPDSLALIPPTVVAGIDHRAVRISASRGRVCAILDDGSVACADVPSAAPVAKVVPGLSSIVDLSIDSSVGCFLDASGVAHCYDELGTGLAGDATRTVHESATPVSTTLRFTKIALQWFGVCALTVDGGMACWGNCFDETCSTGLPRPTRIDGVDRAVALDGELVLRADGSVLSVPWSIPKSIDVVAP